MADRLTEERVRELREQAGHGLDAQVFILADIRALCNDWLGHSATLDAVRAERDEALHERDWLRDFVSGLDCKRTWGDVWLGPQQRWEYRCGECFVCRVKAGENFVEHKPRRLREAESALSELREWAARQDCEAWGIGDCGRCPPCDARALKARIGG